MVVPQFVRVAYFPYGADERVAFVATLLQYVLPNRNQIMLRFSVHK
jgi:hypothetical protein